MAAPSSSSMFANSPNQIPIFDGELYAYWKAQMETIFISQDLWDIVQEHRTITTRERFHINRKRQNRQKMTISKQAGRR